MATIVLFTRMGNKKMIFSARSSKSPASLFSSHVPWFPILCVPHQRCSVENSSTAPVRKKSFQFQSRFFVHKSIAYFLFCFGYAVALFSSRALRSFDASFWGVKAEIYERAAINAPTPVIAAKATLSFTCVVMIKRPFDSSL